eukprot:365265-Chlamydomonas_euryale.AAC.8
MPGLLSRNLWQRHACRCHTLPHPHLLGDAQQPAQALVQHADSPLKLLQPQKRELGRGMRMEENANSQTLTPLCNHESGKETDAWALLPQHAARAICCCDEAAARQCKKKTDLDERFGRQEVAGARSHNRRSDALRVSLLASTRVGAKSQRGV